MRMRPNEHDQSRRCVMSKRKSCTKADCLGCIDDFYNHDGNSFTGQCWCLDSAVMKKVRLVHVDEMPPHRGTPVLRPSCYRLDRHVRMELS